MTAPAPQNRTEQTAKHRYGLMNLARVGGIIIAAAGIAGTREVLPLPYPVSAVMLVGGVLSFFFAPPLLVRRWKAQDRANGAD
jgi:hypothetical protein